MTAQAMLNLNDLRVEFLQSEAKDPCILGIRQLLRSFVACGSSG